MLIPAHMLSVFRVAHCCQQYGSSAAISAANCERPRHRPFNCKASLSFACGNKHPTKPNLYQAPILSLPDTRVSCSSRISHKPLFLLPPLHTLLFCCTASVPLSTKHYAIKNISLRKISKLSNHLSKGFLENKICLQNVFMICKDLKNCQ